MFEEQKKLDNQPLLHKLDGENDEESKYHHDTHASNSLVDNFALNESNLSSDKVRGEDLRKIIMDFYGFQQLTEETLRLILKQGAEDNNLLRISEASYTKLIEALNIPLDSSNQTKARDVIKHVTCWGARDEVVGERTQSIRDSIKQAFSEEQSESHDEYLQTMLASRNTIKEAKHKTRPLFSMEDVMKLNDHEENEINKAYSQKETPEEFEATPAITFVIILGIISVIWVIAFAVVTYYVRK